MAGLWRGTWGLFGECFLPGGVISRFLHSAIQQQVSGHFTEQVSVSPLQRWVKERKIVLMKAVSAETSCMPAQQSVHQAALPAFSVITGKKKQILIYSATGSERENGYWGRYRSLQQLQVWRNAKGQSHPVSQSPLGCTALLSALASSLWDGYCHGQFPFHTDPSAGQQLLPGGKSYTHSHPALL